MRSAYALAEGGEVTAEHGADAAVPWWSVTKTVIAAAALALVRDGKLALDDPVRHRPYTLRQLLQHRAGLVSYGGVFYQEAVTRGDDPWPVPSLLARVDADRLRYPPGQGFDYSNVGYLLVRDIIEQASGDPLGRALDRLVLSPLGIAEARIALARADLYDVAMGDAAGYHPGWVYHGLLVGPLRAAAVLLDRLMSGALLQPALLAAMCALHPLGAPPAGRPWRTIGYGLGLMGGATEHGRRVLGHTGVGPGSVIAVYHFPDETPRRTAASFALGTDETAVERSAFRPAKAETGA
jgi:CubicO group peptidase (beta-lactamase class C family)